MSEEKKKDCKWMIFKEGITLTPSSDKTKKPHDGPAIDPEVEELAAAAYGEASGKNIFEEMAAIANVIVRQTKARGYASTTEFIANEPTFVKAAHRPSPRYTQLKKAGVDEMQADKNGMWKAVEAAKSALCEEKDYSKGAYFWDGEDFNTHYKTGSSHETVRKNSLTN